MEKTSIIAIIVMVTAVACLVISSSSAMAEILRPPAGDYPKFARWLVFQSSYGTLTTLNTSSNDDDKLPFGNIVAFTDGADAMGVPYFFLSTTKDPTGMFALQDPRASFTLSEYALPASCPIMNAQYPTCSKITLSGELVMLSDGTPEGDFAKAALFDDFPSFKSGFIMKPENGFEVFKLEIRSIFLVNGFTAAASVDVQQYFSPLSSPLLPPKK